MSNGAKPSLAVWKFTSCDGCQMSLLGCEDQLLDVATQLDIAFFPEASRQTRPGPYTFSLVEGAISTPAEAKHIQTIRAQSEWIVALGACACSGGIQALKNIRNVTDLTQLVYPHPDYIDSLKDATPISEHIKVDYELRGCPINKEQLLELISALLNRRKPALPQGAVCESCKRQGHTCVLVAEGTPCLGPVTLDGCNALCPAFGRGCYGCFGPMPDANVQGLADHLLKLGVTKKQLVQLLQGINVNAEPFFSVGERYDQSDD